MTAAGNQGATIAIPNVIFVDRKVARHREADRGEAGPYLLKGCSIPAGMVDRGRRKQTI